MRSRVYLETTIISYLTARPARDIVRAAHQQITREWWARRDRFDLFVSPAVLLEAARGDDEASRLRLQGLQGVSILAMSRDAAELAKHFVHSRAVPRKAALDALHVALAVINGLDYVLTWNCRHIANAAIRGKIEHVCRILGLRPSIICTPEELR